MLLLGLKLSFIAVAWQIHKCCRAFRSFLGFGGGRCFRTGNQKFDIYFWDIKDADRAMYMLKITLLRCK